MIKKAKLAFIMSALLMLSGCGDLAAGDQNDDMVNVIFETGIGFAMDEYAYTVDKGKNLDCIVHLESDYAFLSCSYTGKYDYTLSESTLSLTLNEVYFNTVIRLNLQKQKTETKVDSSISSSSDSSVTQNPEEPSEPDIETDVIFYHPNGGTILSGNEIKDDALVQHFTHDYHQRINTLQGDHYLTRDSYILLGWNTKEDLSGDHIGLGSKVTIDDGETLDLYAEWKEETDSSLFDYEDNSDTDEENDIIITGYDGSTDVSLAIPSYIDQKKVTAIKTNSFKEITGEELVLPYTITDVQKSAFRHCEFTTLYMSDSLVEVTDTSFPNTIKTIHINAYEPSKFIAVNDFTQFSDDMDSLMLNQDKKKMIFLAGCSMPYGLDSSLVANEFSDYTILDMGFNGSVDLDYQIESIARYLKDGDIVIHAPEEMSPQQLMNPHTWDLRSFVSVEEDFDLLSYLDISKYVSFFHAYSQYANVKKEMDPGSYDDVNDHYNEYGDYSVYRANSEDGKSYGLETCYDLTLLNDTSMNDLNAEYDKLIDKGATVYFSFGPINRDALSDSESLDQSWVKFQNLVDEKIDVKRISEAADYLYYSKYFYDKDYHLSTEGATKRTNNLIKDIKAALKEEVEDQTDE